MKRRDLEVGMCIQFDTGHWGVIEGMDGAPISVRFADNGRKAMISAFFDEDLSVNVNHVSAEYRGIRSVIRASHPDKSGFRICSSMETEAASSPIFAKTIVGENKLMAKMGSGAILRNCDLYCDPKAISKMLRDVLRDISLNFEQTEEENKHKVITGFIDKFVFILDESNRGKV